MNTEDIEYQVGADKVDSSKVTGGDEHVPLDLENNVIFKRLAEDIYPSPKSGIREAVANATTAVLKSIRNYDLDESDGMINIRLDRTENKPLLVIEDNGIGIQYNEIKLLSNVGKSSVRDETDLAGQFGMGFLALFLLSGSEGGFTMTTKSRKPDSEEIFGVWKGGSFTKFENEDESISNGTRFEIFLSDDIDPDNISNWVDEICEWCRVPVLYTEVSESGVEDEEYGDKQLESLLQEQEPHVVYEDEYVRAVNSPNISEETILLDVPIERDSVNIPYTPYNNTAIRIKTERPIVVNGDNEGKLVVQENQQNNMYIAESKLTESDIVSPEPTGTREKLSGNERFWSYLGEQLYNAKKEAYQNILEKFDSTTATVTKQDICLLESFMPPLNFPRYKSYIRNNNIQISDESILKSYIYTKSVAVLGEYESEDVNTHKLYMDSKDVYMTVTEQTTKSEHAIANDDCHVVHVESTEWYDVFEDIYSWEQLETYDKNVYQDETDDSTGDGSTETSSTNESEDKIIFRFYNTRKKYPKSSVQDMITEDKNNIYIEDKSADKLYLFDQHSSASINRYSWLCHGDVATVYIKDKTLKDELLANYSRISYIDTEIEQKLNNTSILTNNGEITLANISQNKDVLLHIVSDELYQSICTEEKLETILQHLNTGLYADKVPESFDMYGILNKDNIEEYYVLTNTYNLYSSLSLNRKNLLPINVTEPQIYFNTRCSEYTDYNFVNEIDEKIMNKNGIINDEVRTITELIQNFDNDVDITTIIDEL